MKSGGRFASCIAAAAVVLGVVHPPPVSAGAVVQWSAVLGDDRGHYEVVDVIAMPAARRLRILVDRKPRRDSQDRATEQRIWTVDADTGGMIGDAALTTNEPVSPVTWRGRFHGRDGDLLLTSRGRYVLVRADGTTTAASGPPIDTLFSAAPFGDGRSLVTGADGDRPRNLVVDFAHGHVEDLPLAEPTPYVVGMVEAGPRGYVLVGARKRELAADSVVLSGLWVGRFDRTQRLIRERSYEGRNPSAVEGGGGTVLLAYDAATEVTEQRLVFVTLSLGMEEQSRADVVTLPSGGMLDGPHLCAGDSSNPVIAGVRDRQPWVAGLDQGGRVIAPTVDAQAAGPPFELTCLGSASLVLSTEVAQIEEHGRRRNLMKVRLTKVLHRR